MKIIKNILSIILFLIATVFSADGQTFPEPMRPKRIVNDFTGLFSAKEADALEKKLVAFNDSTSTQISVVTISSLDGYDINDYAARLAERWGIGQKGKDNGILLLVKPKTDTEYGEVAISVGYGLEGVIPDITAGQIIRKEIIPEFQQGNFYRGIDKATTTIMDLARGEYTADEYNGKEGGSLRGVVLLIILILLFLLVNKSNKKNGGNSYSPGRRGMGPIIIPRGGGFGTFSGGSGGFGGFGGGSFGGGGASGRW